MLQFYARIANKSDMDKEGEVLHIVQWETESSFREMHVYALDPTEAIDTVRSLLTQRLAQAITEDI
jgi:hypothetical protein